MKSRFHGQIHWISWQGLSIGSDEYICIGSDEKYSILVAMTRHEIRRIS